MIVSSICRQSFRNRNAPVCCDCVCDRPTSLVQPGVLPSQRFGGTDTALSASCRLPQRRRRRSPGSGQQKQEVGEMAQGSQAFELQGYKDMSHLLRSQLMMMAQISAPSDLTAFATRGPRWVRRGGAGLAPRGSAPSMRASGGRGWRVTHRRPCGATAPRAAPQAAPRAVPRLLVAKGGRRMQGRAQMLRRPNPPGPFGRRPTQLGRHRSCRGGLSQTNDVTNDRGGATALARPRDSYRRECFRGHARRVCRFSGAWRASSSWARV